MTLLIKVHIARAMFFFFSSSHVGMWDLDHKEGWALKNWCFQIVVLEKTLENPLDCKIKPINPKRNQPWLFIGRTDAKAEASIFWLPDAKSWLTGSFWCWERLKATEGVAEDEIVRQNHRLNGHESEKTLGNSEGQGSLACCSPWCHKESDTTKWLNNNRLKKTL